MEFSPDELRKGILECNRVALSKAITLIESRHPDHRPLAEKLLNSLKEELEKRSSLRIAVTGIPGAGKSTFIEALGLKEIEKGKKVAVLAIDPSSPESYGSILGDKTRMPLLAAHPHSFIRPSSSGGFWGGVHRSTYESILICEAAGFDCIFIETVGVGQNEWLVKYLCDVLLLLTVGGTGDEIQGIKRGIMEAADIIVINKADGDQKNLTQQALRDLKSSVHLLPEPYPGWKVPVLPCSSLEKTGMEAIQNEMDKFILHLKKLDISIEKRREENRKKFFKFILGDWFAFELEKNGKMEDWLKESPVAFPLWMVQKKIRNMING